VSEPWRRIFDVLVAAAVLVLTSPLLLVAVVAIRLESRGPALYRQRRVGLHGAEFDVLKLRTMVTGAETLGAGLAIDAGDARITRVGALLRRTSLDELPNLVNVLRGEMSIIGPRPTVPVQVAQYTPRQHRRHEVKPGITGWAQIHGRASLPWSQRIELDVHYVDHRSARMDLRILLRTVPSLLSSRGLYKGATGGWDGPPPPS
jgi:lipopolysaccharide/colanic/teichoic acid biosynthesis glycosyltransferase